MHNFVKNDSFGLDATKKVAIACTQFCSKWLNASSRKKFAIARAQFCEKWLNTWSKKNFAIAHAQTS